MCCSRQTEGPMLACHPGLRLVTRTPRRMPTPTGRASYARVIGRLLPVVMLLIVVFGASTSAAQASTPAPVLHVSGTTLTWAAISGVSSYQVATVRNPSTTRDTTYQIVTGTSFRPPAVPGQAVNYGMRAYVS